MKSFAQLKAQFAQNGFQLEIKITTPDQCNSCGMITEEWMKEHDNDPEKYGWLLVEAHNAPGVAILGCPKCNALYFNPNARENIRLIKEFQKVQKVQSDRRIAVASGLVDSAGRPMGLKG